MNDVTFQKNLASVMLDNKFDRFVKNRKTGKLDTKSLFKVNTSNKLFKRKEERKNKHYAITLLVDCSGSMHRDKAEVASESAVKLSKHLQQMDIPHNIVLFNVGILEAKPFNRKVDYKWLGSTIVAESNFRSKYFFQYELTELPNGRAVRKYITSSNEKGYKDILAELDKKKTKHIYEDAAGYNSDAEAIKSAKEMLLKQKGRKIMIVLSDGQPAPLYDAYESPINKGTCSTDYDLKEQIRVTIKSGIELYSVGILDDSVNRYYPHGRTAVISSLNQLYPHIIKLIKKNLKRG